MNSYRSYEEKYPQLSDVEESRIETSDHGAPRSSVEHRFAKLDSNQGIIAEMQICLNEVISTNNIALLRVESVFGPRTYTKNLYFLTFLAAIMLLLWQSVFVYGALNAPQSHAYALSGSILVLMIPLLYLQGRRLHKLEKHGLVAAIFGIILLLVDRYSHRIDQIHDIPGRTYKRYATYIWTDFLLLFSNVPAIIFLAMSSRLAASDRALKHAFATILSLVIVSSTAAVLIDDATMDLDSKHGLFGWLDEHQNFYNIFVVAFLGSLVNPIGYLVAMLFLNPAVVLSAFALEPFIAQILSTCTCLDAFPGTMTISGVFLLIVANVLVIKGSQTMFKNLERLVPGMAPI